MAKVNRRRVAAVLAADADLEITPRLAAFLDRDLHQAPDSDGIQRLEWVHRQDLLLDVLQQELAFGIVAREAERGLRQVVGAERKELRVLGNVSGGQRR